MTDASRLVIFGAGGHAKVVIDAVHAGGKYKIAALVDPYKHGQTFCGYRVIEEQKDLLPGNFVVAVGDNLLRKKIFTELIGLHWSPVVVSHPTAITASDVSIGEGTVVFAGAVINAAAVIGKNCIINTGAIVDHDCRIGDHTHIAPAVALAGCVGIGEGSFIGLGARVIPDITIGHWSMAGAGAVIVRDVGHNTKVVGVPARVLSD